MIIGAHPDDPDIRAGGLALKFVKVGARVRLVSMSNGDKGHMQMGSDALAKRRYQEAQRAKDILGVEAYRIGPYHDCDLEVNLETRREMTQLIREFSPHLIFTHRTCDYHPDHRAVGTLVQDAAYLLGVPLWCPDVPIASVNPAIYFLHDAFTKPSEIRPDIIISVDDVADHLAEALCSHESQFFEWLAFEKGILDEVPPPEDIVARKAFIVKYWMVPRKGYDATRFRDSLAKRYGREEAERVQFAEVLELSEYGYQPTQEELALLFPFV